ncbi:MFS transporter [Caulobacter segnis]|uniref:MFS transporter n=1 Tax=Caulobacter segnis TaxID=88688 RepID=UPI002859B4F0|nr:MFS transporter [Caulobacter segnis]MDR6625654.1 Na+/melibiose symporter-like transporter [Caulobacter segnis]
MTERKSSWALARFASPAVPIAAMGLPLVVYLPEYYVTSLGLSLTTVGAAFLIVKLIDMLLDPVLGGLMDNTRSRFGRFRPWLAAGSPVIAIGSYALFMAQPGVGALYLWFWLSVVYVGYSMVVLSQTAWGAVLSSDYQQRSRVFAWWQGANVVGMILVLCLPPIVTGVFKGDHLDSIAAMGWFIVVLAPLAVLLAVSTVGEPAAPPRHGKAGLKQYFGLLARPSVRRLLIADLLMGLAPGIAGTLFLFFFERMKGFDKTQSGILLLIYFIAALAGAPIWPMLAKRIGKHRALAVASVVYAIVQFATVFMPPGEVVLGMIVLVLAGLPYSAAQLLVRSMMADIGDEERLLTGVDKTGLLYAIVTGTVKLGYALAVGVFIILGALGFDPKTPTAAGDAALIGLYAFAPAALGLMVAAVMMRYPLDANRLAEIQRQLAARDAAEASSKPAAQLDPHAPDANALVAPAE